MVQTDGRINERSIGGGGGGRSPQNRASVAATATVAAAAAEHQQERAAARAAARLQVRFDLQLTLFSLLMHGGTQVASLQNIGALPASEVGQRLASVSLAAGLALMPACFPCFYLRWRVVLSVVYRIVFFSFPLMRQPRGIQRVLDSEAQPGALGLAKDLLRIVWGSRLVAVIVSSALNPLTLLPLVPNLLVLAYSVVMVRCNPTLCASPLLTHPLTAQRVHSFHSAMQLLGTALPGRVGQSLRTLLGSASQQVECEALLSFVVILAGIVLPLALLLATEPPQSLAKWEDGQLQLGGEGGTRARGGGRGGQSSSGSSGGGTSGLFGRWFRRARAVCGVAAAAAEGVIRRMCSRSWLAAGSVEVPEAVPRSHPQGLVVSDGQTTAFWFGPLRGVELLVAWWLLLFLLWSIALVVASMPP